MGKLTSPKTIKALMSRYGFHFSKSLGQNFIIDENVLERIVTGAEIGPEDDVLEIGPGIGVMTEVLCEHAKRVVAIEIDSSLMPILSETVGHFENLRIINKDVLKVDLPALIAETFEGRRPKLVANLPYYVTTPIIMTFLEQRIPISDLVVMIQKEVADRILASPSSSDYGALSVVVQYFTEPSIVTRVSKGSFMPAPKVDSTVIRLHVRETAPVALVDEAVFFNTIRDAFGKRRKTLQNALSSGRLGLTKAEAGEVLAAAGIPASTRGEALDINAFANLANAVARQKGK
jgi:16S rRNA (adenine1518-N6/adenine1519-N6)-dimethyltransferase